MSLITDIKEMAYLWKHRNDVKSGLGVHGHVFTEHYHAKTGVWDPMVDEGFNTFTTEGMALILNTIFKAGSAIPAVYCGIFLANVTPALADTAAAKLGAAGTYEEGQDAAYTPNTNRPAYTIATTSTAAITNAASKASFTGVAASDVWYGAFLATSQAKTATTGALLCAKKFTTAKTVETADVINVLYEISMTTS